MAAWSAGANHVSCRLKYRQTCMVHTCPCCGYRTLPSRHDYELCPVCWWEDDGAQPWEVGGPNGVSLIEAQQEFLRRRRPYVLRPGRVRAPKRRESRDSAWRPIEVTEDVQRQMDRARTAFDEEMAELNARVAEDVARDPEGPLKEYNAAMRELASSVTYLSHAEVERRFREVSQAHGMLWPQPEIELLSRRLKEPEFYSRHPFRAAWWLLRYSRPSNFARRFKELRTGTIRFSG